MMSVMSVYSALQLTLVTIVQKKYINVGMFILALLQIECGHSLLTLWLADLEEFLCRYRAIRTWMNDVLGRAMRMTIVWDT